MRVFRWGTQLFDHKLWWLLWGNSYLAVFLCRIKYKTKTEPVQFDDCTSQSRPGSDNRWSVVLIENCYYLKDLKIDFSICAGIRSVFWWQWVFDRSLFQCGLCGDRREQGHQNLLRWIFLHWFPNHDSDNFRGHDVPHLLSPLLSMGQLVISFFNVLSILT